MTPAFGWVQSFWYRQTLTHVTQDLRRLRGYVLVNACVVAVEEGAEGMRRCSRALVFGHFGLQFRTNGFNNKSGSVIYMDSDRDRGNDRDSFGAVSDSQAPKLNMVT